MSRGTKKPCTCKNGIIELWSKDGDPENSYTIFSGWGLCHCPKGFANGLANNFALYPDVVEYESAHPEPWGAREDFEEIPF